MSWRLVSEGWHLVSESGGGSSLPDLTGNTGKVLTVNATEDGTEWAAGPAPAAAGSDTQVLFNDGGVIAGDSGLTFDKTTNGLSSTGPLTLTPTADVVPLTARAYSSGTNHIIQWQTSANAALGHIAHDGSIDATGLTLDNPLALAEGGTGADLSAVAKGGLVSGTGSGAVGITTVGTDGQVLTADAASAGGIKWAASAGGGVTNSAGANVIPKSDGTNLGASSITDTGSAITVGTASGTPQAFTYKLAADGTGSNIAAGSATILPGIGTGTGAAARLLLGGPKVGSTGSSAQSTATPVSIGGEVKADGTESFLNVTGTLPASPSAGVVGVKTAITSAGTASRTQYAVSNTLAAGYTGSLGAYATHSVSSAANTGPGVQGSVGVYGGSDGAATESLGVIGTSTLGTRRVGVHGLAYRPTNAENVIGGYFALTTASTWYQLTTPTASAAVLADNGGTTALIADFRDNGTTKVSIEDGGALCGNNLKTLTESSATGFVEIAVAAGNVASAVIDYEIEANDATDFQTLTGSIYVSGVNKAGTVTATVGEVGTPLNAVSAGTLTNTMTVTAGTGKFTVNANAVSSLTQTTLRIKYLVRAPKPVTATSL